MRFRYLLCLLALSALCHGQAAPQHPPITGISHVAFYSSNLEAAKKFYGGLLGLAVQPPAVNNYEVGVQQVELEPLPAGHGHDLIAHVAFATPDAEGVRKYLANHGVTVAAKVNSESNGTVWFALKDPEGNPIEFVQERPELTQWLEYMLVRPGEQPSPRTLGILNHIALGVSSVSAAAQLLRTRDWKPSNDEKETM